MHFGSAMGPQSHRGWFLMTGDAQGDVGKAQGG